MHDYPRSTLFAVTISMSLVMEIAAIGQQGPGGGGARCDPRSEVGGDEGTCAESPAIIAVYSSGNIAVPIPTTGTGPGWMAPVTLNISDFGYITDLNLRLRANHTFDGDLQVYLLAPGAFTPVLLMANLGGAGDNLGVGPADCSGVKTIFDDDAPTAIEAGAAPFAGSYSPMSPLSTLSGISIHGAWTVQIFDAVSGDVGTLFCAELQVSSVAAYPIFADGFESGNVNAWS